MRSHLSAASSSDRFEYPVLPTYPRLGGRASQALRFAFLCGGLVGIALLVGYLAYLRGSSDASPDSPLGIAYAVGGTFLFLLVGVGYVVRKRLRKHAGGMLQTALSWHIVGGVLALALILMHAAGNFHPRSGTYALYGLIAVVVSGLIGRAIDRWCPRVAALASLRAVRTEDAMRKQLRLRKRADILSASSSHHRRFETPPARQRSAPPPSAWQEAQWDLAYYDLPSDAQSLPPALTAKQRAAESHATPAPRPEPVAPILTEADRAHASADILRAMERMRLAVAAVRIWRRLHQALCVLTVGLLIWHLVFAATLVLA